jgi:cell division protein FtsB
MARNRKYQPAAIRFGPVVKALLLCVLFGGSGVGYVWQKAKIYELGQQIRKGEMRLTELHESNKKLRDQLAMLRSPQKLEQRARELNLGLAAPQPSQIWRMIEPTERLQTRTEASGQFAARQNTGQVMP